MEETLTLWLKSTLQGYSVLAFLLVLAGGIITSIGPCNMSLIPLLMAYVGGTERSRRRSLALSVFFTLGTSTAFALLGLIASFIGGLFGSSKSILVYIAAGFSLLVGLKMLGISDLALPSPFTRFLRRPNRQGLGAAYLLGLVMGLAGSQCGTPVLFAILALVMSQGHIIYGTLLLFLYGLGRGLPVIIAGTLTGYLKASAGLAKLSLILEKSAGSVLVIIAIYLIWIA